MLKSKIAQLTLFTTHVQLGINHESKIEKWNIFVDHADLLYAVN